MTILQLISSAGFYGAESMMLEHARELARVGYRSLVAAMEDGRNPGGNLQGHAGARGLQYFSIPCRGRWDRKAIYRLRTLLGEQKVDVVHSHGYKSNLYAALAARGVARRIATCHNWPQTTPLMALYARIDRLVLRSFAAVAAPGSAVVSVLRRAGVAAKKIHHIPNGVNVERFEGVQAASDIQAFAAGRPVVGFVGRLVPGKGGLTLLASARELLRMEKEEAHKPSPVYVFVGEGPCREEWERTAQKWRLQDRVLFIGNRDDMPAVYRALDLMVLPSLEEALPMTVLEAMAARVPVVATPVGDVPDLVVTEQTGLLVPCENPITLARAISRVLRDGTSVQRWCATAHALVCRHYSVEQMAQRYLGLYCSASNASGHVPSAA